MPRAATGPMPRAGTGSMPRAATGPRPRPGAGAPSGEWETPVPRAPRANGRPWNGGQQDGDRRPRRQAPRDADWTERDGGNVEWNYDLPPWDGGAPEPDPGFRYREPGPGMPGYRGSRNPYRGGDNLR
jgi:hypothetical protein